MSICGVTCRQDECAALKQYVHGSPSGGPVWFLEDRSRSRDQSSGRACITEYRIFRSRTLCGAGNHRKVMIEGDLIWLMPL